VSLTFRWLGVAGIELKAVDQVLVIDPFFTRPSLIQMLKPLKPDSSLAMEKLASCDSILVTHSHYDHLMDVPEILRYTGAIAYGSANTCQLLHLLGVPATQAQQVRAGDKLFLGAFQVEVFKGQHSTIPFNHFFNGSLRLGLQPPLRVSDFRMDVCLGYRIAVLGVQILVCAAEPRPADILFTVAQESKRYYTHLLKGSAPRVFIPVHWDDFTRPLGKPLKRFTRPGRLPQWQVVRLARQVLPHVEVIIPEIFREYTLGG
jgi:L-ascorbate metabolism protein UlaG (beta-lactamase superfamily)